MFKRIQYRELNARQKESYNYHKIAAILVDYGFNSIKLSDDWQNADFIAQSFDGNVFLKIQLKGRLTIDKKYIGKDLYIAFPNEDSWYIYPHDEIVEYLESTTNICNTVAWQQDGIYNYPNLTTQLKNYLEKFKLGI